MEKRKFVHIYFGNGTGKTSAAFGQAVKAACEGRSVFLIQFMKGKEEAEQAFLKKLEPEIKVFTFDKFDRPFGELSEEEKLEEKNHMRTGLSFARKVLATGECDVVILDEILRLTKFGFLDYGTLRGIINSAADGTELILTGADRAEELWPDVDEVTEISTTYKRIE